MGRKSLFLLVLGLFVTGFFQPMANAATQDQEALSGVMLEAKKGGYQLIDSDELWALYQGQQEYLILVDTRQEWEYSAGFIKNARNFPLEPTWLARMTRRGELEHFLGPDKSKILVFY